MDPTAARRARAEARSATITLRRGTLQEGEHDLSPVGGAQAISLLTRLTRESWSLSGHPFPEYTRDSTPYRFVPGRQT